MTDSNLIHCSYHKCLTVYFRRVMHAVCNRCVPWRGGYRHFNSHLDDFYRDFRSHRVASVNNRALDLTRLGAFRLSRFVRDPRDLVVSGYFYHKRGAEPWTTIEAPTEQDWYFANGIVPAVLRERGGSFAGLLRSIPLEEGLLAELEFRRAHFDAMADWPDDHPDILTLRYEDVVDDEVGAFRRLAGFYGFSRLESAACGWFARRYARRAGAADRHVRDPTPGQWREVFTPRVREAFAGRHEGLLAKLGYPAD